MDASAREVIAVMPYITRVGIHLIGALSMTAGIDLLWRIPDVQRSPTGYYFSVLFGPTLLLLGWRALIRRYWAGAVLAALGSFAVLDWLTGPRAKNEFGDLLFLFVYLFLLSSLTLCRDQWIKKL